MERVEATTAGTPGVGPAPERAGGDGQARRVARLERAGSLAGPAVAALGVVVLAGWTFGLERLKRVAPGLVAMNPVTALCFVMAGASLWLTYPGAPARPRSRQLAAVLALVVLAIALTRLEEYFFGIGPGVDRLLFRSRLPNSTLGRPNRMAPNTALGFIMAALSLLLIDSGRRRLFQVAQGVALVLVVLAFSALLGYTYSVTAMYGVGQLIPMALHTAFGLGLLALGLLFARPRRGLMAIITSDTQAGQMARRLLPATVLVPAILGGLHLLGHRGKLYEAEFGTSILVVGTILFFGATVLWNARALYNAESERRRAVEALTDSEAFYHNLVESLPQNILRKDLLGRFTFANQRCCRVFGRTMDELIGRTDFDLFPAELAEKYRHDDLLVLQSGEPFEAVEKHVTPDGQDHYVQVMKTPLTAGDGEVVGIQGIFWDVTERKRVDEELRKSRERFEVAVRGSKDGLWDWDVVTNAVYFSPQWKAMLGHADDEVPNRYEEWARRIHPDDRDRVVATVRDYLEGRLPEYEVEFRMRHRDGSYRWILARGVALRDEAGRPYRMAGSHTDITARKEAERTLSEQNRRLQELADSERQALEDLKSAQSRMVSTAKLAGLGQMVAGVAHEINNPLSYVNNNVAVLQRDLGELGELIALYREGDDLLAAMRPELHARLAELCDRIDVDYTLANLSGLLTRTRDGLRRIQQIVKDLRVFARLDESELNEVDLNVGVESTATIAVGSAKKKGARVELDLTPLPPVVCYPAKINQVIMNLISNAIDACGPEGHVTVRTRPEPGSSGVRIEVEDDGCGIDPAVRERIFDPFFTTKPIGIGTGLGLSISYGIVQDHGGQIEVDSAPGRGSRFTIHLPTRIARRPEPAAPAPPTEATA